MLCYYLCRSGRLLELDCGENLSEVVFFTGNVLERVQRVHEPADHLLHLQNFHKSFYVLF